MLRTQRLGRKLEATPCRYRGNWLRFAHTLPVRPLAFDLHEPTKPAPNAAAPILFLHGLFGSKKNNRGISK